MPQPHRASAAARRSASGEHARRRRRRQPIHREQPPAQTPSTRGCRAWSLRPQPLLPTGQPPGRATARPANPARARPADPRRRRRHARSLLPSTDSPGCARRWSRCSGCGRLVPLNKDAQRLPAVRLTAAVEVRHGVKGDQEGATKLPQRHGGDRARALQGAEHRRSRACATFWHPTPSGLWGWAAPWGRWLRAGKRRGRNTHEGHPAGPRSPACERGCGLLGIAFDKPVLERGGSPTSGDDRRVRAFLMSAG